MSDEKKKDEEVARFLRFMDANMDGNVTPLDRKLFWRMELLYRLALEKEDTP